MTDTHTDHVAEALHIARATQPSEMLDARHRIGLEKPFSYDTSRENDVTGGANPLTGEFAKAFGGGWIGGSFTNEAGTRTYKLYIPSSYMGQSLPLVVMLHGCTQSPTDFASGTRMNELAEKEGFFVLYPEQSPKANGSKCWNWFEAGNQVRNVGEPSLIAGITRSVMRDYSVSAKGVYVVGMSAGGAMAVIMAATYPDLYTAVGVHSGLPYGAAHDLRSGFEAMQSGASHQRRKLKKAVPLILFHGDHDSTVAKSNADQLLEQWLKAFEDSGRPAGDPMLERGMVGGRTYTRLTYHDADGKVFLEEWIIHQAGHAWSGGSPNGSFTDQRGPDASAEMVRFLCWISAGREA